MSETKRNGAANGAPAYRVIGTRPVRHDGYDKVTGRAIYGADIRLPGLLYGKVLRSPVPHARIKRIDASGALSVPGVHAVVTGADLPWIDSDRVADLGETAIGVKHMLQLIIARDKVFYKGHAVAAVAAVSPHVAEEALSRIEVEYEPLPVVEDVLEAMKETAPVIHEDLRTRSMGTRGDRPTNVASHIQHVRGDVEQGFAQSDVVIEREYRTQMVHQGYIEPQNATALAGTDGRVTVWTSTQGAFSVRQQVADILQMPISRIKVVPLEIGGGFGGKVQVYLEPLAVVLSQKTGRPVKLAMTRAEVFEGTGPGSPASIRVKLGARRDGKILAAEAFLAYDAGAFPGSPVGAACLTGLSPYAIPNLKIDGYDVVTNKPHVQAYRAPGATPVGFAVETALDELAEALGMDPIDLRLANAAQEGDRMTNDVAFNRIGFKELLEAVKAHPHYRAPLSGKYTGRGVACGFWMNGGGRSTVTLTFNPDGTVNLVEGSADIGGTRIAMAMIAAEELGLPAEAVNPQVVDTDSIGHTDVTGGSRTTYSTGTAVWRACQDAKAELKKRAAILLEVDEERIAFEAGRFFVQDDPEKSVTVRDIARQQNRTGGPIVARGVSGGLKMAPSFSANIIDVAVDPETGKVSILRCTAFQDAGKAIHPSYVEGQMQGGTVQGLGWGLTEEYVFEGGIMKNPTLLDYRMLTALDLPMIEPVIIEVPASDGPYGVRGVGEASIVPPPAAAANAIYRAVGVRLTQLPMSPETVYRALQAARREAEQAEIAG
ncbi:MAG TPA: xanthine dehydrogenase family protein molybdopterin-binding subunit [Limnochordia bacterium]